MRAFSTLLLAATLCVAQPVAAQSAFPFPQHVNYAFGAIRPSNHTQAQLDQDVRDAYAHWKSAYLLAAGTDGGGHAMYRVVCNTDGNDNTVSEGQGYGMVIVALMAGADPDARTIFDGLYRYFNAHHSAGDPRLMSWNINSAGQTQEGNDSAYDGDSDIALGLLLADRQWGNAGAIAYLNKALLVIAGQAESVTGPVTYLPLLGDWVEANGAQYNQYTTRPSDFMPSHFVSFASASGLTIWKDAIVATREVIEHLQLTYAASTGLVPDFAVRETANSTSLKPAPANFLEGAHDGHYNYNAGRVPWRLATQALLHSDVDSARQARRMSQWVQTASANIATNIHPGYLLNGTPITTSYFTSFFAAPFGVAAMVTPSQQTWLNAVYDSVRTRQEGYYEDSVNLLSMMVMSGTYWDYVAIDRIFADGIQRVAP
ncbi:MAG: glycosyl hydrolase family 8 [Tahibacter sp.]